MIAPASFTLGKWVDKLLRFVGDDEPPATLQIILTFPASVTSTQNVDLSAELPGGPVLSRLRSIYVQTEDNGTIKPQFQFSTGQTITAPMVAGPIANFATINVLQVNPIRFNVTVNNPFINPQEVILNLNNFFINY